MNIRKILFWIFFILGVIFVIWYFVGDSPTLEQALLIIILGLVIKDGLSINDLKNKIDFLENRVDKLER